MAKFYIHAQVTDTDAAQDTVPGFTEALFQTFETLFVALARDYPVTIIEDIWTGIWGRPHLKYDTIHPNAAGYAVMFEHFWNAIKSQT
jgi:lysophospholipase L1-like esterase